MKRRYLIVIVYRDGKTEEKMWSGRLSVFFRRFSMRNVTNIKMSEA